MRTMYPFGSQFQGASPTAGTLPNNLHHKINK
jgi:hypothetical protein